MENAVTIHNNTIRLQAMLAENSTDKAVVVTHPHPLYGGNMDNPVVIRIVQSYAEQGFSTLRFNFRGTGRSTGMFDNSHGEQSDVEAALVYLKDRGYTQVSLAGYSFGSRVNCGLLSQGIEVADHVLVSPPVGFMSFDDILEMPVAGLVVSGSQDDIAPADKIEAQLKRWGVHPKFKVLKACDHFYSNCLDKLGMVLDEYLS